MIDSFSAELPSLCYGGSSLLLTISVGIILMLVDTGNMIREGFVKTVVYWWGNGPSISAWAVIEALKLAIDTDNLYIPKEVEILSTILY